MAAPMMQSRAHLRIQAICSQPARPRCSVLVGSRQQPAGVRHQRPAGLQQQPLSLAPMRPIGHGLAGTPSPVSSRQMTIMRSFLGVGAPEAILVAVVALVVFGPKGLADAAKSLGQTLRAFQPTIKEVVEVSQEIKGTLEQELGLDELRSAATMRPTPRPIQPDASTSSSSTSDAAAEASSSGSSSGSSTPPLKAITEDLARQLDPEIELKRAMSEQAAWGGQPPAAAATVAAAPAAAGGEAGAAAGGQAAQGKDLSTLSLEELEAELARRRNASSP